MALLLAMYQKMRLVRERNQLTLDLTKVQSKQKRVQKSIEKIQKRYTSILANLDSQAKRMESSAKLQFANLFGVSSSNVNIMPNSLYGSQYNFNSATTMQDAQMAFVQGAGGNAEDFNRIMKVYMDNGGRFNPELDDKNNAVYETGNDGKQVPKYKDGITAEDISKFQYAMQCAQQASNNRQQQYANAQNTFSTNVSIWLENAKAQVEAEQDAMLEPLNYEDTMLELEITSKDTRLKKLQQEEDSYKQLVDKEIQNSTPTFGLG